jgi:hypothetical protein
VNAPDRKTQRHRLGTTKGSLNLRHSELGSAYSASVLKTSAFKPFGVQLFPQRKL